MKKEYQVEKKHQKTIHASDWDPAEPDTKDFYI